MVNSRHNTQHSARNIQCPNGDGATVTVSVFSLVVRPDYPAGVGRYLRFEYSLLILDVGPFLRVTGFVAHSAPGPALEFLRHRLLWSTNPEGHSEAMSHTW